MKKISGGATIWARKTVDSIIFYDKPDKWFKIWFFIVNQVNHCKYRRWEKGQGFMTYAQIMEKTRSTKNQVDHCIRFLKKEQMLATQKATRGLTITVLKYDFYQDLDNYKSDTESELKAKQKRNESDTINKNDKNDNNDKKRENTPTSKKLKEPLPLEKTLEYLNNIPPEDIISFKEKYDVNTREIQQKADGLYNWCQTNGKIKKNYKTFLRGTLNKDFGLK